MLVVCELVKQPNLVEFTYKGKPRIAVIAVHGHHRTTNKELVRAFQVHGASSTGPLPDWRLFAVSEMFNVVIRPEIAPQLPAEYRSMDSDLNVHCAR